MGVDGSRKTIPVAEYVLGGLYRSSREESSRDSKDRRDDRYGRDDRYSRDDRRGRDGRDDRSSRDRRSDREERHERYSNDREDRRSERPDTSRTSSSDPTSDTPRRGGLYKRSEWTSMTPSRSDGSFTPRSTPGSATPRRETGARSSVKSSDWDYATPQVKASGYEEISLEYPEENVDGSERMKWEEEQAQLDRDWYQMEENGAMDETHNPFAEYEVHDHEKEEELAQKQIVSLCTYCLCPQRSCSNHQHHPEKAICKTSSI